MSSHSELAHIEFFSQNRPGVRMGMGHYEDLLIRHLLTAQSEFGFGLTFSGRKPETPILREHINSKLQSVSFLGCSTERLSRLPWFVARGALNARAPRASIHHALSLGFPIAPKGKSRAIISIHDLAPLRFPDEGQLPKWAAHAAQQADAIITLSHASRTEIIELMQVEESRVHVAHCGCEHDEFHPGVAPLSREKLAKLGIPEGFVLFAGGASQRKNVASLLEAWKQIETRLADTHLVLIGAGEQLKSLAQQSGAARVICLGYLERAALPSLMKASVGLVTPSVYEGFGLPPLEAMALGVPVVAVKTSALPEVLGDCAVYAQDGSPESLAAALSELLQNEARQLELKACGPKRAAQFSWENHAAQILELYRQVLN